MDEENFIDEIFSFLDYIPLGICILKEDLNVLFWNKCLSEWTNLTKIEIVGTPLCRHFPHLEQPKYISRLRQIFSAGTPTIFSSQLHRHFLPSVLANGDLRVQHTTVMPIPSVSSQGLYALLVIQDVTELTKRIKDYRQMQEKALLEIKERQQVEISLLQKTQQLEQHNLDLINLSRMGQGLQNCKTLVEAYEVITEFANILFPGLRGEIFLELPGKQVEKVVFWGEISSIPQTMSSLNFWNFWLTNLQLVHPAPDPKEIFTYDLIAWGNRLGFIYIQSSKFQKIEENQHFLAINFGENISLALANLQLQQTLQYQSTHDPLTGLSNRRSLETFLAQELFYCQRSDLNLGVIMVDVDHFKKINDNFGHKIGDLILYQVASLLKNNSRSSDLACRYGGEEFIIILPKTDLNQAYQCAEKLRQIVEITAFGKENSQIIKVTVSLGVASYPEQGNTLDSLLHSVDQALYRAKSLGRNQVAIAEFCW